MLKFHETQTCFGPHRTIIREYVVYAYTTRDLHYAT